MVHPMSEPWLLWKRIQEHPECDGKVGSYDPNKIPRVFVYSKKIGGIEFGKVYRLSDGYCNAQAEGYHGDWEITHYAEIPTNFPEDV